MSISVFGRAVILASATVCLQFANANCQETPPLTDTSSASETQVLYNGTLTTPEQVALANQKNVTLDQYAAIRLQSVDSFEGQTQLARWCEANNLRDQRDAHLKRALLYSPENATVRNLLGHVNVNGSWLTREQMEKEQKLAQAAQKRMAEWQPRIREIGSMLLSDSQEKRESGLELLEEITDPRSVTALEMILAPASEPVAQKTVELIGKFCEREATEALLRISLFTPWESVRKQGLDLLATRNRHDFVPILMSQLVTPFSGQSQISTDARGNVLYQYVLFQRDMDKDAVRQFDSVLMQNPFVEAGVQPNLARVARVREQQANQIVTQLNNSIQTKNRAIQTALNSTTGADPGISPEDWWRWWYDENGVTMYERPVKYTRVRNTELSGTGFGGRSSECLVAGTPIWTDRGPVPVESLMIGDLVLSQESDSKKLEYRVVLQPTVRPPTPTFQMWLDGEAVQASGGHLFWVNKMGWTQMRDLEPGFELLSASGSPVAIEKIEPAGTVELYNLIVDRNANYFIGQNRILSHDSTILARGEKSVEQTGK